ncbi:glycosyltransferase family 2 protein [Magnetospirillum moscoviense]|uniref:Family 2 glycosyl transferase n=1 Tax=Magnetospirillum moscoviense TaxID=1437059 RepID=A0A178MWG7_9PROT|nr:glycosyltransferase family 2 protein [Magnetospirillum moscoviense]OAN55061.1 family 2 glycosyl transferase [Magnetospirillum moscoviense]
MISVVIPAYNEEDAISETVATLRGTLTESGFPDCEIIVVDDGSTDQTGPIATAAGARVLRNLENLGYGQSLKVGIAAAKNDTVVISDADGTYPIDRIPDLIRRYQEGWDMVVGARTGDHYRESAVKAPLRRMLQALVEFTAGRAIPDPNSGLRVFSRSAIMPFFPHLSDRFSFTTSSTLAYMLMKRTVLYIPIDYHKRIGTTKVRLFRDSLRTIQYIVSAIVYYNPLKLFLLVSGLCAAVGLSCLGALLLGGGNAALWGGITALAVAVIVFALGLLAEQIHQVSLRE